MAKKKTRSEAETPAVDQIIRANVNRETAPGPDFVSLYANDTQVQISPWDFRIIFGLITEMPSVASPTVSVKLIGEVRMSPQHAKKVAQVLIQQLQNYETNIGPVPQPD